MNTNVLLVAAAIIAVTSIYFLAKPSKPKDTTSSNYGGCGCGA